MSVFNFFRKKNPTGEDSLKSVVLGQEQEKKNFLDQFLPEDPEKRDALARSLLMGGASMMAAGGPSATPTNIFSVLGQGLAGGVSAYDKTLATNAETAKARAAKEQANMAMKFASSIGGPNGDTGYTPEQLAEIYKYQVATGDEAGARDTLGMIQQLQQTGAKNGMVVTQDGFRLAPGYGDSLYDTKKNESLGSAVGQNAQKTTDQKDFEYGAQNPAFRQYEDDRSKANQTNVTVSTAPKDGKLWEAMDEQRKNAEQSMGGLKLVYEMKNSLPNAITGFGSDYLLMGQKAIAALGGDSSKVVDTETLKTQAMELAAKMKGELVGNQQISNSDMEFVQRVSAGDTTLDSGTIGHLIDIREKQLKSNIERYNSRIDELYPNTPDNEINRNYFGGITVPEDPYKQRSSNGSDSQPVSSGNRVVRDGYEYFVGPDGKKYKRKL